LAPARNSVRSDRAQGRGDALANRRRSGLPAREMLDRRGKTFGIFVGRDDEPAGHILGNLRFGPDQEIDRDAFGGTRPDCLAYDGIPEGPGNADELQSVLIIVDAT